METLDQINEQIAALSTRAEELLATAEADSGKVAEVKSVIDTEIKPALDLLTKDREIAVQAEEMKALSGSVTTLNSAIDELRKPSDGFSIDTTSPDGKSAIDNPYASEEFSWLTDIKNANKGRQDAIDRLLEVKALYDNGDARSIGNSRVNYDRSTPEGKAMTEGTGSQGGYLVQPQLERQLVLAREADNVLRGLCSSLNVTTNAIQLDQLGLSTTAGWVSELATKPESTAMTLATITASVFTAAGLATISNQLLQDSNPAVDQLVTLDLAKRLVALEEISFLNGSGTGQPLGLLNTPGLGTQTLTQASLEDPSVSGGLLDTILSSIAEVQTNWGQPSAIVMHPRTWTRVLKSKDSVGHYTIAPRSNFGAGYDPSTARTFVNGPQQTLFGVEVILSNRIPTNLGTGTNQSRVIVGDFKEALILDRQGITVDESPHVYFTSNQTVFRAESRVGFTAARSPLAFSVIGGTGLANG